MNVAQSQNLNWQAKEARRLSEPSAAMPVDARQHERFGALRDGNRPRSGSMLQRVPKTALERRTQLRPRMERPPFGAAFL